MALIIITRQLDNKFKKTHTSYTLWIVIYVLSLIAKNSIGAFDIQHLKIV